jgi:SRSO17 transposase
LLPYVIEHLGAPDSVLVIDETGFLKKGRQSAGVARQYSGTAGRVEHGQIGVFLAYASAHGYALLDRALSLPKEWTPDRDRCDRTGIPRAQPFATKPELARQRLERALRAGVPATWVTGESVYGDDRRLRMWLEAQDQAYVLAVSGKAYVWLDWHQRQVKTGLAAWPAEGWTRCRAGAGTQGPRWSDWYGLPLADPIQPEWRRWLVVRRSVSDAAERTAFVVFAPQTTTLEEVMPVAGRRWTIERSFEAATGEVGLDHYEVRSWTGWYRHITLAMWALALRAVLRAAPLPVAPASPKRGARPTPSSLARFKPSRGRVSP